MNQFFIITNESKDQDRKVTNRVASFLNRHGKSVFFSEKTKENKIEESLIPKEVDCVLVIGGDGSLIEAARVFWKQEIPILGINMGTLGYLAEIELAEIESSLEKILKGEYDIVNRMMLSGELEGGRSGISLNDIVITRTGTPRILSFYLYVNGELLNEYEADGIIVSTPTGSTAYSLSAGGPIVEPSANILLITPICCHALYSRSIVLSAEDEIWIEVGPGRRQLEKEVVLTFDGVEHLPLETGSRVIVKRSEKSAKFLQLNRVNFLETLRKKMKGS